METRELCKELLERYGPELYGYALRKLGNVHRAEEVFSDLSYKVLLHARVDIENPRAWLFKVMRTAIIDWRKRQRRQPRYLSPDEMPELSTGEETRNDAELLLLEIASRAGGASGKMFRELMACGWDRREAQQRFHPESPRYYDTGLHESRDGTRKDRIRLFKELRQKVTQVMNDDEIAESEVAAVPPSNLSFMHRDWLTVLEAMIDAGWGYSPALNLDRYSLPSSEEEIDEWLGSPGVHGPGEYDLPTLQFINKFNWQRQLPVGLAGYCVYSPRLTSRLQRRIGIEPEPNGPEPDLIVQANENPPAVGLGEPQPGG